MTITGRGYIKRQPVAHVPPPAPRREGDHRPRHPRGGRGRAPARRQHPRLGAVLHQPRPGLQRQGPLDPGRQPPGQGHPDHQPAGRPGGGGRGAGRDDRPCRTSSPATTWCWPRAGQHQEDAPRAVRAGPLDGDPGDHDRRQRRARLGRLSTGEDDIIIATAQGMLARFAEGEVRPMGRDAAGRHRHPARSSARATTSSR